MRVQSTSSLAPASDSVKTVPLRPAAAAPLGVTKTVAPSTASLEDAASSSHADFAGESALGDAGPGAPNWTRRRAMLISGAAACVGAFVLLRGLRAGQGSRARLRPSVAASPPARSSPPASAPFPAAPSTDAPVTTPPADDSDARPAHTVSRRRHATAHRRPPTIDGHGIAIPAD